MCTEICVCIYLGVCIYMHLMCVYMSIPIYIIDTDMYKHIYVCVSIYIYGVQYIDPVKIQEQKKTVLEA